MHEALALNGKIRPYHNWQARTRKTRLLGRRTGIGMLMIFSGEYLFGDLISQKSVGAFDELRDRSK